MRFATTLRSANGVIAGLDPAIHRPAKEMDARVKPGHDESGHKTGLARKAGSA